MKRLIIGIGGTGTKVMESFVYLSMMGIPGLLGGGDEFHLRLGDTDDTNGNKTRLETLLSLYDGLHDKFGDNRTWRTPAIKTRVVDNTGVVNEFQWSISFTNHPTLGDMVEQLNYADPAHMINRRSDSLFDALYSNLPETYNAEVQSVKGDMQVPLSNGFYARPKIGALVFEHEFERSKASYWDRVDANTLDDTEDNRVMFVGSLFGGTGASGIPTISRKYYESYLTNKTNSTVGITLMLPYYTFVSGANCPADSSEFAQASRTAIRYYNDSKMFEAFPKYSVFLLGNRVRSAVNIEGRNIVTAPGSAEQRNPSMPAELMGALALLRFFESGKAKKTDKEIFCYGAQSDATAAVPGQNDQLLSVDRDFYRGDLLQKAFGRLQMFCCLWKIISHCKPIENSRFSSGAEPLKLFIGLPSILDSSARDWNVHLGEVDKFVGVNYSFNANSREFGGVVEWVRALKCNGLDLSEFDTKYSAICNLMDQNIAFDRWDLTLPKGNRHPIKITKLLGEVANARVTLTSDKTEYHKLLHKVIKVCSGHWN
jgi:hypothetical protein